MPEVHTESEKPRRSKRKAAPTHDLSEGDAAMDAEPLTEDEDEDVEEAEMGEDSDVELDEDIQGKRSRGRTGRRDSKAVERRTSSRATRFTSSLAENAAPPISVSDSSSRSRGVERTRKSENSQKKSRKEGSPQKSRARRNSQRRRSLPSPAAAQSSDEEVLDSGDSSGDAASEDEEDEEPLRIQRIIASRTETRSTWKSIGQKMNSSEIDYGSRWFQESDGDGEAFEERFLVKWADLSYLHVSWESQGDMLEQVEGAKTYLNSFFKKSINGLLLSADERNDGDYFDPAYTQIDRILEVTPPDDFADTELTVAAEEKYNNDSFGMVFDKSDPDFERGSGRQFIVKWKGLTYANSTSEFERDLILADVEYKDELKAFLRRREKPKKKEKERSLRHGHLEQKKLGKMFGIEEETEREKAIKEYQHQLCSRVYKNGGQLRDYQAEGVSWMISNYLDGRSSILADEMGLGKTLQTAAFVNILKTTLRRSDPVLIVVPLSTISHWHREFKAWTDLNAIVYHGSQEDRDTIRRYEMAYECDRPAADVSFNQLYLRKCIPRKTSQNESPWMVDVVITTPEMIVAEDVRELTAINWDLLVVDEAHRLKNRTSKLAVNLRDQRFNFHLKLLLTGTPIQNSVEEFFAILNFIDGEDFHSEEKFMEAYGDMKSKEKVDELHNNIRPYILRRLKEDVEKSVPQKSETLIEVELTLHQKQWYRALYEKNLKFLHKNKKKALDGPGLNNLAMELRKCCNHLFLLNGVEEEMRKENAEKNFSEVDHLVNASGKLVLLDKLLPRLKDEGHRILIFSQFKIMLDILEDYFNGRKMKFERIDGSITGSRRQQAIDRFQKPPPPGKEAPFIMMLSTRAGGVGINLTAADTVIIFDSDFNPQNDLQAQARCHRIGQTKTVKVYRLLTRKTYEMQMFHMSSLKMGLDQVVLKGFENNSSGEGALSKAEVEKLLRHGAYDIFNEDKEGRAEAESNDFIQQDIDSIMERRSRTVVHKDTGSSSNAAGGTFSKARFTLTTKSPDANSKEEVEDVDIEDPDFWKKMVGEPTDTDADANLGPRQRKKSNYSESDYHKKLEASLRADDPPSSGSESESEEDEEDDTEKIGGERVHWGGSQPNEWKKDDVEVLINGLSSVGYGLRPWDQFFEGISLSKKYDPAELKRMCWSLILTAIAEVSLEEAQGTKKREERAAKKKNEGSQEAKDSGGVLALETLQSEVTAEETQRAFVHIWASISAWAQMAFDDAVAYASTVEARDKSAIAEALNRQAPKALSDDEINSKFAQSVWPSLKGRGWTATVESRGAAAGKTRYLFDGTEFFTIESVLRFAQTRHTELAAMIDSIIASIDAGRRETDESDAKERSIHLKLNQGSVDVSSISTFLECYAPLQLLHNRLKQARRLRIGKKVLSICTLLHNARTLVGESKGPTDLEQSLVVDSKSWLPHPRWSARHDAILVRSIVKHGWVEQDSSCRAISEDASIRWGSPFDSEDSPNIEMPKPLENGQTLLETAQRAARFLTDRANTIESGELKGFNLNLVARTYGLSRSGPSWIVDQERMNAGDTSGQLQADLPTKKDLVRRAKLVLTRTARKKESVTVVKPKYNYVVIDQANRCCLFLAEVIRCYVRLSVSNSAAKSLLDVAIAEAYTLQEAAIASSKDNNPNNDGNPLMEFKAIHAQLNLVKKSMSKGATQAKNVLRVMLGEEPLKPKRSTDAMFPTQISMNFGAMTKQTSKVSSDPLSHLAIGKAALERARDKVDADRAKYSYKNLNATSVSLRLTGTETVLALVLCEHGMPIFRDQLGDDATTRMKLWEGLGKCAKRFVEEALSKLASKLAKAKKDSSYHASAIEMLEEDFLEMESVLSQAEEYAQEPDTLAKKVLMMVGKIRQTATPPSGKENAVNEGLGTKVPTWLDEEATRWAGELDLLDDHGRPLGFTAADFLFDVPEEERRKIRIASVLDRKACWSVYCQIACLTRVYSVAALLDNTDMKKSVLAADSCGKMMSTTPINAVWWESLDPWHVVDRVLTVGLTDKAAKAFLDESDKCNTVSTAVLQKRLYQLLREMHQLVGARESIIRADKMRAQNRAQKPSKAGHQSSMMAFLSGKAGGSTNEVIDLSAEDESPGSKRKSGSLGEDSSLSSAEKKHRLS